MSQHDDLVGRLETYLDDYEGYTPLPGSIRDAVRDAIPTIKQSGPPSGLRRIFLMTLQLPATARYGLAAAAVVAVALLGINIFGFGGSVGGPDSPSAEPSATATATEALSLIDSIADGRGNLAPGRYELDLETYPGRIEFEVPEGWWYWTPTDRERSDAQAILVNSMDTGAADGSAWGLSFTLVDAVRVDPCDPGAGDMDASVTESPESLAAAFGTWADFPASEPEDVSIGGYSGKRIEIRAGEGATCAGVLFTTPASYPFELQQSTEADETNQFTFLDVDGSVLVIWTTDYAATSEFEVAGGASPDPEAHVQDQVDLRAILDSIVIEPRAQGSGG